MKRLLLIICLIPTLILGADIPSTGTLIVTYQTDSKSGRLDRVRFWLKNENHKQSLYPRGTAYVDDEEKNTRMVVIDDLEPGNYTIDFLFPNLDGRFASVPERKVKITRGEVVKIDQQIKQRKGYWSSRSRRPAARSEKQSEKEAVPTPVVEETVVIEQPVEDAPLPEEEILIETSEEESEPEDFPEKEEKADLSYGKLIVSYELKNSSRQPDDIRVRLTSSEGKTTIHPMIETDTIVGLENGKMIMIPQLPTGDYTLEFTVENSPNALASKAFEVKKDRTRSIHQALDIPQEAPKREIPLKKETGNIASLTLTANIPTAEFELVHRESGEKFEAKGREAAFNQLPTGSYDLYLYSYDPFFIPPNVEQIEVHNGENVEREVTYTTLGRVKISMNISEAMAQITPMDGGRSPYKKEIYNGEVTLYLPEGKYRVTFLPIRDRALPDPVDIDVKPLHTEQVNIYFPMG